MYSRFLIHLSRVGALFANANLLICVSLALTTLGTARAQISIAPTEESYSKSLTRLSVEDRLIIEQELKFTLDERTSVFEGVFHPATSRSLADLFSIDCSQYIAFLNKRVVQHNSVRIAAVEFRVEESEIMDTGTMAYRFKVNMRVIRPSRVLVEASGTARGSRFSVWRVWNASKNPLSVDSANVGFFTALLSACVDLQKKIESQP
jgi:hypothetical protein